MPVPALAAHVGEAAWTIACVTLLYIAVYRIADKELRVWIAVNDLLAGPRNENVVADNQLEGQDGAKPVGIDEHPHFSELVAVTPRRHSMMSWVRRRTVSPSLAVPIVLSVAYRFKESNTWCLDWTVVAIACVLVTFAATTVLALFKPEVAVVAVPTTKPAAYGLFVTDSKGKALAIGALDFEAARKIMPAVSVVMCFAIILANNASLSATYAALIVSMTMLGPLTALHITTCGDMKMKGWVIFMGSALGGFALLALLFMIPSSDPPRDPHLSKEESDRIDGQFKMSELSVLGIDLVRVCIYAQYGFLFTLITALLRFDYEQKKNSSIQYGKGASSEPASGFEGGEGPMRDNPTLRTSNEDVSVSLRVSIPRHLPFFSAPTFTTTIIASYLATVIAVLIFPTRELSTMWMPVTLVGQSLGSAFSITWNKQWKAFWRYEEIWRFSGIVNS